MKAASDLQLGAMQLRFASIISRQHLFLIIQSQSQAALQRKGIVIKMVELRRRWGGQMSRPIEG